jgi:K+-transporting ATPase ATPase C chain
MKEQLKIAVGFTLVTTLLFGLGYPLAVTGLSHLFFAKQANGSMLGEDGRGGSSLIGQPFSSEAYFHSRPSAAGNGYDPMSSGGSNLGPTNHALVERVQGDVQKLQAENPGAAIPIDLVTTSASGLDPDISPAAARFQVPRIARARKAALEKVMGLIEENTTGRQFGMLGEPRVNVLQLNRALDAAFPVK